MGGIEIPFGGNRFVVTPRAVTQLYRSVLADVDPALPKQIEDSVIRFGYLKEQELLDLCYNFPEFQGAELGETICESNLSDSVELRISDDESEDLELALNPRLINSLARLTESLDEADVDWERVKQVDYLQASGT